MSLAGGTLLTEERNRVHSHIERCERCRSVAEVLSRPEGLAARPRRWLTLPPWAAAAAVLVAAILVAFGPSMLRGLGRGARRSTDETLVALASSLSASRPDLFAGFTPVSREERLAPGAELRAGEVALHYPVGRIFEGRPTFRWEGDAGEEAEVILRTARAELVWRGKGTPPVMEYPSDAPELEQGVRYVWEVRRETRVFARASAEERAAFEASVREIEGKRLGALSALLTSHLAFRRMFFAEAERVARTYHLAAPEDPVGRETLALALRRLGLPEPGASGRPGQPGGGRGELDDLGKELALARERGDRTGEVGALGSLGTAWLSMGDYAKARDFFEMQLALGRDLGDKAAEVAALKSIDAVRAASGAPR